MQTLYCLRYECYLTLLSFHQGTQTIAGALTFSNTVIANGVFDATNNTNISGPLAASNTVNISGAYTLFGSTIQSSGTASASSGVVTATGTPFNAGLVGGIIVFANGVSGFIIQVVSTSTVNVFQNITVSSQAFSVFASGTQIDNSGNAAIGDELVFPNEFASSALYLDANNAVASVQLSNGQLLIGSTGAHPVAATISPVANQVTV